MCYITSSQPHKMADIISTYVANHYIQNFSVLSKLYKIVHNNGWLSVFSATIGFYLLKKFSFLGLIIYE